VFGQCPQQRRTVVHRLDDIEVVGGQQPDHPVAQQDEILGQYDAHATAS
jgi:hypothetical protein